MEKMCSNTPLVDFHAKVKIIRLVPAQVAKAGIPRSKIKQAQLLQYLLMGEMLQTTHDLCGPPLDPLQYLLVFLVLRTPELDTADQIWSITALDLLAILFSMHPRIPLALLDKRMHYWLMVNLLSTKTPRSFSRELLSSMSAANLY
ncbi:hypothetical protein BTVI_48726 [Pitangus sulphuratus]|nr:hypothetical protein BTVI_48726 [Pitangus sulphuratus]